MKHSPAARRSARPSEIAWKLHSPAQVKALLLEHEITPGRGLGQHFLIDDNIVRKIVAAAELDSDDLVVEIGPGLGVLTRSLAPRVRRLIAIEKDRRCCEALRSTIADYPHVEIHQLDALDFGWRGFAESEGPIKLVSNLPYQISKPMLRRVLEDRICFASAVLMIQSEVAERLTAKPGSKAYGILSVAAGLFARIQEVTTVSPNSFYPPPKVKSTVVRLTFPASSSPVSISEPSLFRVIAAAFHQRRKTLFNSLTSRLDGVTGESVAYALEQAGVDGRRRAETLEPAEFVRLTAALAQSCA